MTHLLDANVVIKLFAGTPKVIAQLRRRSEADVGISSIVLFELTYGALNGARVNENLALLDRLRLAVVPFEADDARDAGQIRSTLKTLGSPIGPYDTLVAGHARARGLTLVTHNVREFSRVPGLLIEDWEA